MEGLSSSIDTDTLEEWLSDIEISWPIIFAAAGFAIVIGLVIYHTLLFININSFVFTILVRFCAGLITWIAIIAWIAAFILLGIFLGQRASAQKE